MEQPNPPIAVRCRNARGHRGCTVGNQFVRRKRIHATVQIISVAHEKHVPCHVPYETLC